MFKRNLHTELDLYFIPSLLRLVSIEEEFNLLSVIHVSAELLKSRLAEEVISICILGKLYWFIVPHHLHGLPSDEPIFPIDQYFIALIGFLDETVICDILE